MDFLRSSANSDTTLLAQTADATLSPAVSIENSENQDFQSELTRSRSSFAKATSVSAENFDDSESHPAEAARQSEDRLSGARQPSVIVPEAVGHMDGTGLTATGDSVSGESGGSPAKLNDDTLLSTSREIDDAALAPESGENTPLTSVLLTADQSAMPRKEINGRSTTAPQRMTFDATEAMQASRSVHLPSQPVDGITAIDPGNTAKNLHITDADPTGADSRLRQPHDVARVNGNDRPSSAVSNTITNVIAGDSLYPLTERAVPASSLSASDEIDVNAMSMANAVRSPNNETTQTILPAVDGLRASSNESISPKPTPIGGLHSLNSESALTNTTTANEERLLNGESASANLPMGNGVRAPNQDSTPTVPATVPGLNSPALNSPALNSPALNSPGLNSPGLNSSNVELAPANPTQANVVVTSAVDSLPTKPAELIRREHVAQTRSTTNQTIAPFATREPVPASTLSVTENLPDARYGGNHSMSSSIMPQGIQGYRLETVNRMKTTTEFELPILVAKQTSTLVQENVLVQKPSDALAVSSGAQDIDLQIPAQTGVISANLPSTEWRSNDRSQPTSGVGILSTVSESDIQFTNRPGVVHRAIDSAASAQSQPISLQDPLLPSRLGQQIRSMADSGIQSATLRVNPAELGPVQIEIAVERENLSVSITTAHAITKELLESALPRLREQLGSQQGFAQVNVDVAQQEHSQRQLPPDQSSVNRRNSQSPGTDSTQSDDSTIDGNDPIRARNTSGYIDAYA